MASALSKIKREVLEANLALKSSGLVVGTSGNASAIDRESGLVVIKPSGVEFEDLTVDNLSVVDLEGSIVDGPFKPSVDTDSHLVVYRARADVGGIVHTHSPFATSFAVRGEPIEVFTTTHAALFGGPIPISDYAVIGEKEIGKEILRHVGDGSALLLRSHGVFTIGANVQKAFRAALYVEESAEVNHIVLSRGPMAPLEASTVAASRDWYVHGYGQSKVESGA